MSDGNAWAGLFVGAVIVGAIWWNNRLPDPEPKVACFEFFRHEKDDTLLVDKCSGKTFMLVKVTLRRDDNSPLKDSFTYRWYELQSGYGEPQLVSGWADERLKR